MMEKTGSNGHGRIDGLVGVNIGGTVFQTSHSTLDRSAFFLALFRSECGVSRDGAGNIFVDREPELFAILLRFLRTGRLIIDGNGPWKLDDVVVEAEFYQISLEVDDHSLAKLSAAAAPDNVTVITTEWDSGNYHDFQCKFPAYDVGKICMQDSFLASGADGKSIDGSLNFYFRGQSEGKWEISNLFFAKVEVYLNGIDSRVIQFLPQFALTCPGRVASSLWVPQEFAVLAWVHEECFEFFDASSGNFSELVFIPLCADKYVSGAQSVWRKYLASKNNDPVFQDFLHGKMDGVSSKVKFAFSTGRKDNWNYFGTYTMIGRERNDSQVRHIPFVSLFGMDVP